MKCFILIAALFFFNSFLIAQQDLRIEISCDKPEVIQGEYIDILVKVINRTNKSVIMKAPKHYLYDYNNGKTFTNQYGEGRVYVEIPPKSSYYFFVDPQSYLMFKGMDFSTRSFPSGSYDYYVSLFVGGNEIKSNKINLKVKPVPDSLKLAYEDLRFDFKNYDPNKNYSLEAENKFKKYKDTYYEKEFYNNYLQALLYNNKKNEVKIDVFKNFILKYPNSEAAYFIFRSGVGFDNNKLTENLLTNLKTNNPNCMLLMVLRHQPKYMNGPLQQLLK